MIFDNYLEQTNLLSSPYLTGNVLFHSDTVYSPVLNYVKKIDLKVNHCSILPFQTHNHINKIIIHPNGALLIAIDVAGYAVVFNVKGMFIISQYNFKGSVIDAGFSSDGMLVYIAQNNGFCVYQCPPFWRTFEPFVLIKKYKNRHSQQILSASFTPDSRFLITCGQDNNIYVNNLFPIQGYIAISLQVHKFKILGIKCSKDMQYLYSVDSGSNVYVWKWIDQQEVTQGYKNLIAARKRRRNNKRGNTQKLQDQLEKKMKRQNDESNSEQQDTDDAFHPQYSQFQAKAAKGRYILSKKLIVTKPGGYLKRFYYDNKTGFLATAYSNGKFSIFKLLQQQLNQVQTYSIGNYKISTLSVNQSCTWLAMGVKSTGQLIVWEWKSQSYILNQKGLVYDTQALASYKNGGKVIASGTIEGQVKLWDKLSGFCVATFTQHNASVTDIKFSNATTLFSCGLDGNVYAYDASKYKKFRNYRADSNCQFNCLTIQEESGDIVFAGAFDPYQIYAWNVQTANILQIIKGHEGPISCLQTTGEHLVTGSWDRTLKIHQIYARKLNVQTFEHSSQVTALALHPDGKQIAAATIKGQIYIWDVSNGQFIGVIQAQMKGGRSYFSKISAQNDTNSKYLKTIVYTECGKYILGGGKSKYLNVYDVKNRILIKRIEMTRNRDLQGAIEKLNSKFVKQGQTTYQMHLQEQEQYLSDEQNDPSLKLPGSKKIDISQIRKKLEVQVRKIVFLSNQSFAVCTSFGIIIYSTNIYNKFVFNPYELLPNITPQTIKQLLINKQYSSAIIAALSLNVPINSLLKKIPGPLIKQAIAQLNQENAQIILQKLSSETNSALSYRECVWVDSILRSHPNIKIPGNLRASIQAGMVQQVQVLKRVQGKLEMAEIMTL